MSMARPWRKWLIGTLLVLAVALLAIPLGWAVLSRDMPELQPWHTRAPRAEFTAADENEHFTLADYLKREDAVMREGTGRDRAPHVRRTADARQPVLRRQPVEPDASATRLEPDVPSSSRDRCAAARCWCTG